MRVPKNTAQCPRPGLELGLLGLKISTLIMRPLRLPQLLTKGIESVGKWLILYFYFLLCTYFRAEAYQSIIMLMGRQQLYAHWHNQAKVNHMEWTEDEAAQVLEAWKREFTKVRRMIMLMIAMMLHNIVYYS